jgi:universal stress protein E
LKHLKRVLCAVDIAETDRNVFAHALSLARRSDAFLLIVHAASPVMPLNHGATERVDFLKGLRSAAEAAGVDARVTVQRGDVAGVILLHAKAREADLIVLGAGHRRGDRQANSIAERVAREAPSETLVVPQIPDLRPTTFERILCAVDLSPSSQATVQAALRLGEPRDRRVTLVHVVNGPEAGDPSHYPWLGSHEYYRSMGATALEELQSLIPSPEHGLVLARVAVGNPVAEILGVAQKTNAQLLVIGGRPRNSIGRRLFGRTRHLIREASCPVLAVPKSLQARADEPERRDKVAA